MYSYCGSVSLQKMSERDFDQGLVHLLVFPADVVARRVVTVSGGKARGVSSQNTRRLKAKHERRGFSSTRDPPPK